MEWGQETPADDESADDEKDPSRAERRPPERRQPPGGRRSPERRRLEEEKKDTTRAQFDSGSEQRRSPARRQSEEEKKAPSREKQSPEQQRLEAENYLAQGCLSHHSQAPQDRKDGPREESRPIVSDWRQHFNTQPQPRAKRDEARSDGPLDDGVRAEPRPAPSTNRRMPRSTPVSPSRRHASESVGTYVCACTRAHNRARCFRARAHTRAPGRMDTICRNTCLNTCFTTCISIVPSTCLNTCVNTHRRGSSVGRYGGYMCGCFARYR